MKKRRVILFIMFIVIILLGNKIYAKYQYIFHLEAFSLSRDASDILYSIEKIPSEENYTNQDVILKIVANKEIEPIEGFMLSEDKRTLTRVIPKNEQNRIVLEDLSGNTKDVSYDITHIDKEPPSIIGIEDGEIYHENRSVDYTDNIGIKDIFIDRYAKDLTLTIETDFYDANWYYGIDVTGNKILARITEHPKNTKYYKYYINNQLMATTEEEQFTFSSLTYGTTYNVLIEAIDESGNILKSASKVVKTKYFSNIVTNRVGDNFTAKISGIDSRVKVEYCALWNETVAPKFFYPTIHPDGTLTIGFDAKDLTGITQKGYYYFQVKFIGEGIEDFLSMNIMFGNYQVNPPFLASSKEIDPYQLTENGYYQIIVTDLAGNRIEKNIQISKQMG